MPHSEPRGVHRRTVHRLWPDEAQPDNTFGQPGDYWEQWTAASLLTICGPKNPPTSDAAPRGTWPAPVTIGAKGDPGTATPPNERGTWTVGNTYAINDFTTRQGLRWQCRVPHTAAAPFDRTLWVQVSASPVPGNAKNGDYVAPWFVTAVSAGQALNNGVLYTTPIRAPLSGIINGLSMAQGALQVGGVTTFRVGLFADDGTDGFTPDWAAGPLMQTTFDLTSGAANTVKNYLPGNMQLEPSGLYHLAILYTVQTAPTTPATVTCVSGAANSNLPQAAVNASTKGFGLPGYAAFPTTNPGPVLNRVNTTTVPVVGLRASA